MAKVCFVTTIPSKLVRRCGKLSFTCIHSYFSKSEMYESLFSKKRGWFSARFNFVIVGIPADTVAKICDEITRLMAYFENPVHLAWRKNGYFYADLKINVCFTWVSVSHTGLDWQTIIIFSQHSNISHLSLIWYWKKFIVGAFFS